ncbi:hypothetical protein G9A89_006852 [Geosiphon pyriformis]|nr:hypothetical protein G9A89_006852 [Geosiphon pyriformis]
MDMVINPEIRVKHSIEDSLPGGILAIKLKKKLTKLQFWEATDKTITIESLFIIQRTQPNPLNTNLQTQTFRSLSTATRFEHQVTGLLFNPIPEIVTCNTGQLLFIKLLFKNKLSVSILGLYAGASSVAWFSQTGKVNSLIAKAVNKSSFIILDGDFNKDGSHKSASFKRCLDLGLINSLLNSPVVKSLMWKNSRGVKKTIDFMLVSSNLVNAVVNHNVVDVSEHFNTDYWAVSVSVGLGGLLDTQLNFLCMQANRDHWKFDFRSTNDNK